MVPGSGFSPGATAMKEPMSIFKEFVFHGGGGYAEDRQLKFNEWYSSGRHKTIEWEKGHLAFALSKIITLHTFNKLLWVLFLVMNFRV